MNAVLWKDYRVNRVVLIVGLVLLLGPPIVGVAGNLIIQARHQTTINWFDVIVQTGTIAMICSLITMTLLGGNAFAGERADRSAEFMAYLPPTRKRKLASKVMLALGSAVIILGAILLICYALAPAVGEPTVHSTRMRNDIMSTFLPVAALMLAVSWCGSSFLSSPTYAVGIGFVTPWLLFLILALLEYCVGIEDFSIGLWFSRIAILWTLLAFFAGCGIYLRRVEP